MSPVLSPSTTLTTRPRAFAGLALLAASALALTACGSSTPETEASATTEATNEASSAPEETSGGEWPRTFENADGTTTEIPARPKNIVSTSVTVSGTLLAFDAPLVASGSAGNGNFFAQWAPVAEEREVGNLWAAGEVDLEAIYAYNPDLIVVSSTGADSVADQVAELQAIAPTIVVDYGGQTWQELSEELGEATGMEEEVEQVVADFDAYVADAAAKITVPAGTTNVISFNGAGESNPIARKGSAQGLLLTSLGFTIEDPNVEWHTQGNVREDFVWATYENLTELTAETTLILTKDNEGAQAFATDPVLANLPSVKAGQVYGLGLNSFRIDKYSATEIVDGIVANFAK